jgi:hypothetical protein
MHDTGRHKKATMSGAEIRVVNPDLGSKYDLPMAVRGLFAIILIMITLIGEAMLSSLMGDARLIDPEGFRRGVAAGYIVAAIFGAAGVGTAILRRKWWGAPAARPPILHAVTQVGIVFLGYAFYSLFPRYGGSPDATPFQVGWEATLLAFILAWMILYFSWVTYRHFRYGFRPIFFSRGTASGEPCATWLLRFSAEEAAGRPVTVARCDCGWTGRLRLDRQRAKRDAERHAPHHSAPTHGVETRLEVRRSLMSRVERHRAKPYGFDPPKAIPNRVSSPT